MTTLKRPPLFLTRLRASALPLQVLTGASKGARSLQSLLLLLALLFTIGSLPSAVAQTAQGVSPHVSALAPGPAPEQLTIPNSDGQYQAGGGYTFTPPKGGSNGGQPYEMGFITPVDGKVYSFFADGKDYVWDNAHKCYFSGSAVKVYQFYKNADGNGYTYKIVNGISGHVYETGTLTRN